MRLVHATGSTGPRCLCEIDPVRMRFATNSRCDKRQTEKDRKSAPYRPSLAALLTPCAVKICTEIAWTLECAGLTFKSRATSHTGTDANEECLGNSYALQGTTSWFRSRCHEKAPRQQLHLHDRGAGSRVQERLAVRHDFQSPSCERRLRVRAGSVAEIAPSASASASVEPQQARVAAGRRRVGADHRLATTTCLPAALWEPA
jgi:hypothetical protein